MMRVLADLLLTSLDGELTQSADLLISAIFQLLSGQTASRLLSTDTCNISHN